VSPAPHILSVKSRKSLAPGKHRVMLYRMGILKNNAACCIVQTGSAYHFISERMNLCRLPLQISIP